MHFAKRGVLLYHVAMVITYHGAQCFKVSFGDTTLVFDPISKKSKLEGARFGSDVVFISLNHPDMNGAEEMAYGSKQPFVVNGPGEYEIGEVTARGYGVKTMYENVERYNTIYRVMLEGINMVFLGALGNEAIDPKILGELDDIDILFVPIGGGDVLDVPAATKLATKLEARCIIPMHYTDTALKAFFKEEGIDAVKPVEKLTIKKKDLAEMESEVVVLGA
jgi:L-ascorbate metabolism protein UlaG (beta-lactamase superfamily)